jgi:type VI secretion system protein ImpL
MEPARYKFFSTFKWPLIITIILFLLLALVLVLINATEAGHKKFVENGFFNNYTLFTLLGFTLLIIILLSVFFIKNASSILNKDESEIEKNFEKQKKTVIQGMKRVSKTLRSSRGIFWRNISYNYKLPWFLVCGAPQSGKSTFLSASGLRMPTVNMEDKNIDLSFNTRILISDAAVYIDSAGPCLEPDNTAIWEFFISRLRRFRPTQPVNGIILVVDVASIQQSTHARLSAMGLEIREHLVQLQNSLGVTPPVYLVLSKIDQLSGFTSFFKGSPPTPTNQVFGLTLPLIKEETRINESLFLNQFNKEFDDLVHWQLPRMLERTNQELMPKNRYEAFMFLTELMGLRKNISYFIDKAFSQSQLDENLLLRGVYFVNGLPVTRFKNNQFSDISNDSSKTETSPNVEGLFIKDLLGNVVLNESGLVGFNEKAKRFLNRVRAIFISSAASLLLCMVTWQIISFSNNNSLLDKYITGVESARQQLNAFFKKESARNTVTQLGWTLPVLEALQDIPAGWNDTTLNVPLREKAGLSQRNILNKAAIDLYIVALRTLLLPRLFNMLETTLTNDNTKPADLYENLMVYLMFSGAHSIDNKIAHSVLEKDFKKQYPGLDYEVLRNEFSQHLHNLLEVSFKPESKDRDIVWLTRVKLKDFSPAQRGFILLTELPEIDDLPHWRSQDAFGPLGNVAIKRRSGQPLYVFIPGLYTSKALTTVVMPSIIKVADIISKEDWVLYSSKEKAINSKTKEKLRGEITGIYVKNYIDTWDNIINDLDFLSFGDFKQEASLLQALVGPPSPLDNFLVAVSQQTSFTTEQNKNADQPKDGEDANIKVVNANHFDEQRAKNYINDHFSELHSFVNGTPSTLSEVLKHFSQIKNFIGPIAAANSLVSPETGKLTANTSLGLSLDQLQSLVIKAPPSVEDAVNTLIRQTTVLLETVTKDDVEAEWKGGIAKFCQRSINNHFPFTNAKEEVTLNDFIRMFAPDGMMDQFFDRYVRSYVDTSTSPWTLLVDTDSKLKLSPAALHYFEQASWIKKVFFPGGSKEPRVSFGIAPTDLDIKAKGVVLDIGGQSLTYQYGSQQMQTMLWPNANNGVRVNFASTDINQTKSLAIDGPWALFRLIQMQKFEKLSATRFALDIIFSGRYASFLLEAATVDNPFQKDILRGFKCLPSLVGY